MFRVTDLLKQLEEGFKSAGETSDNGYSESSANVKHLLDAKEGRTYAIRVLGKEYLTRAAEAYDKNTREKYSNLGKLCLRTYLESESVIPQDSELKEALIAKDDSAAELRKEIYGVDINKFDVNNIDETSEIVWSKVIIPTKGLGKPFEDINYISLIDYLLMVGKYDQVKRLLELDPSLKAFKNAAAELSEKELTNALKTLLEPSSLSSKQYPVLIGRKTSWLEMKSKLLLLPREKSPMIPFLLFGYYYDVMRRNDLGIQFNKNTYGVDKAYIERVNAIKPQYQALADKYFKEALLLESEIAIDILIEWKSEKKADLFQMLLSSNHITDKTKSKLFIALQEDKALAEQVAAFQPQGQVAALLKSISTVLDLKHVDLIENPQQHWWLAKELNISIENYKAKISLGQATQKDIEMLSKELRRLCEKTVYVYVDRLRLAKEHLSEILKKDKLAPKINENVKWFNSALDKIYKKLETERVLLIDKIRNGSIFEIQNYVNGENINGLIKYENCMRFINQQYKYFIAVHAEFTGSEKIKYNKDYKSSLLDPHHEELGNKIKAMLLEDNSLSTMMSAIEPIINEYSERILKAISEQKFAILYDSLNELSKEFQYNIVGEEKKTYLRELLNQVLTQKNTSSSKIIDDLRKRIINIGKLIQGKSSSKNYDPYAAGLYFISQENIEYYKKIASSKSEDELSKLSKEINNLVQSTESYYRQQLEGNVIHKLDDLEKAYLGLQRLGKIYYPDDMVQTLIQKFRQKLIDKGFIAYDKNKLDKQSPDQIYTKINIKKLSDKNIKITDFEQILRDTNSIYSEIVARTEEAKLNRTKAVKNRLNDLKPKLLTFKKLLEETKARNSAKYVKDFQDENIEINKILSQLSPIFDDIEALEYDKIIASLKPQNILLRDILHSEALIAHGTRILESVKSIITTIENKSPDESYQRLIAISKINEQLIKQKRLESIISLGLGIRSWDLTDENGDINNRVSEYERLLATAQSNKMSNRDIETRVILPAIDKEIEDLNDNIQRIQAGYAIRLTTLEQLSKNLVNAHKSQLNPIKNNISNLGSVLFSLNTIINRFTSQMTVTSDHSVSMIESKLKNIASYEQALRIANIRHRYIDLAIQEYEALGKLINPIHQFGFASVATGRSDEVNRHLTELELKLQTYSQDISKLRDEQIALMDADIKSLTAPQKIISNGELSETTYLKMATSDTSYNGLIIKLGRITSPKISISTEEAYNTAMQFLYVEKKRQDYCATSPTYKIIETNKALSEIISTISKTHKSSMIVGLNIKLKAISDIYNKYKALDEKFHDNTLLGGINAFLNGSLVKRLLDFRKPSLFAKLDTFEDIKSADLEAIIEPAWTNAAVLNDVYTKAFALSQEKPKPIPPEIPIPKATATQSPTPSVTNSPNSVEGAPADEDASTKSSLSDGEESSDEKSAHLFDADEIEEFQLPANDVQDAPKPVEQEAPKPVVQEAPKPVVQEAPKPVAQEAPKPVVQEEARKQEEENKRKAEQERIAAEARKKQEEEAKKQEEETKKKAEQERIAAEERKKQEEEAKRTEEETKKKAEQERIAAEERKKQEEEAKKKEEEAKKKAEQERIAEEARKKQEEEQIKKAEKAYQEKQLRQQQEKQEVALKKAEQDRIAAEARKKKEEEEKAKQAAQALRDAKEKERLAEEAKKEEEQRTKKDEENRLKEAERKKKEEEKQRQKAEQERLKQEKTKAAEEDRKKSEQEKAKAEEEKRKKREQENAKKLAKLLELRKEREAEAARLAAIAAEKEKLRLAEKAKVGSIIDKARDRLTNSNFDEILWSYGKFGIDAAVEFNKLALSYENTNADLYSYFLAAAEKILVSIEAEPEGSKEDKINTLHQYYLDILDIQKPLSGFARAILQLKIAFKSNFPKFFARSLAYDKSLKVKDDYNIACYYPALGIHTRLDIQLQAVTDGLLNPLENPPQVGFSNNPRLPDSSAPVAPAQEPELASEPAQEQEKEPQATPTEEKLTKDSLLAKIIVSTGKAREYKETNTRLASTSGDPKLQPYRVEANGPLMRKLEGYVVKLEERHKEISKLSPVGLSKAVLEKHDKYIKSGIAKIDSFIKNYKEKLKADAAALYQRVEETRKKEPQVAKRDMFFEQEKRGKTPLVIDTGKSNKPKH